MSTTQEEEKNVSVFDYRCKVKASKPIMEVWIEAPSEVKGQTQSLELRGSGDMKLNSCVQQW